MREFVLVGVTYWEDGGGLKLSPNSSVQYNWPSQVTAGIVLSKEGQLQIRTKLQFPVVSRNPYSTLSIFSFCIDFILILHWFCIDLICNNSGVRVIENINWGYYFQLYTRDCHNLQNLLQIPIFPTLQTSYMTSSDFTSIRAKSVGLYPW